MRFAQHLVCYASVATFLSGSAIASGADDAPIFGIGSLPCAEWLASPVLSTTGQSWILGYLTAVNKLSNGAGRFDGTKLGRLMPDFEKRCRLTPKASVADIANEVDAFWALMKVVEPTK